MTQTWLSCYGNVLRRGETTQTEEHWIWKWRNYINRTANYQMVRPAEDWQGSNPGVISVISDREWRHAKVSWEGVKPLLLKQPWCHSKVYAIEALHPTTKSKLLITGGYLKAKGTSKIVLLSTSLRSIFPWNFLAEALLVKEAPVIVWRKLGQESQLRRLYRPTGKRLRECKLRRKVVTTD